MSAPPAFDAFFRTDGDQYLPTPLTRGPWGESLSGTFIGGMLAHAVQRDAWDDELNPTRFTVDLLRPVALAPLRLRTTVVRQGKRLKLVDAEMLQADTVVARASTLLLRPGAEPPGEVWSTPVDPPPLPAPLDEPVGDSTLYWMTGQSPEKLRPAVDFTPWQYAGPKRVWVRELRPLIDGVALTPFTRAALAGDVASSLTQFGTAGLYYINPDYTLTLTRLPQGPDIGLTAITHYSHGGIATGVATMFDHGGPIGSAVATGLARSDFRPPAG